jgi:NAD-dependent deacetylase
VTSGGGKRKSSSVLRRDLVDATAQLLLQAKSALFITGAGMSADSGVPTYRGIGGLYRDKDNEDGVPIDVALSGEMLTRKPALTWRHISTIEAKCRGAKPNRGHEVLAALEQRLERALIFTQNVDGLHRAAGSENVIEIHGHIYRLRCTRCDFRIQVRDYSNMEMPPSCPDCKGLIRPDVVLFGEALPGEPFAQLQAELDRGFDVVFSIGTTALFPYVARPILVARAEGVPTVEINPGRTDLSDVVDVRIKTGAARALDAIWAAYLAIAPKPTLTGH